MTAGVSTSSDPLVGQLVDGRYQITNRLARGGMATVYAAVDTRLTRTVALKVMHIGLGDDAEFARKFDREARSAAKLSHPNVVSVFDQGTDSGRPYIVMEYVEGHTLRDVLNNEAPVTPLRAMELIEPVLAALVCAHDAGLVHRDIKPENVLISPRGQVKVADFGLAKAISAQTSTATQGLLIGTVSYLPPELVVSGRADARSDVYSTGVVLFELLTGRKPHTGETPIQVAYAHVHNDVPAPSSLPTATPIPPYLDALVARATARDANHRPADAKIFLAEFRRVHAALRQGLPDDPALTAELRGAVRPHSPLSPQPWAQNSSGDDRADHEITQLVQPAPAPLRGSRPEPHHSQPHHSQPHHSQPHHSQSQYARPATPSSPPTVRDAAPPGPNQAELRLSAERQSRLRERTARRRRRGILILLLVFLLTTAAALTGWYVTEGRFTSTPALTSLPQGEAEAMAQRQGLKLDLTQAFSETVTRGVVISTDPTAGAKIVGGGTMTATVSKGPERFAMPKVVGMTQNVALAALRRMSLKPGQIKQAWHETVAAGVVLATSSKPGTLLKRDTAVGMTVSKGPEPIKIRDYEGKSADTAVRALEKAGFTVRVTTANSDTVDKGDVISQDPRKGDGKKGDVVTLERSLGPVLVRIPADLRGKSTAEASKQLKALGFKVRVRPVAVNYIGAGLVVTTSPGGGNTAPKGSRITIFQI